MKFLTSSIRTKIIFPYILLTFAVGVIGAYILTALVFDSAEERLDNQMVTAANVASDTIVEQENQRLTVLRQVSNTEGMPEAVAARDFDEIHAIIWPIAATNPSIDSVIIVDTQSQEMYKINRRFVPGSLIGGGDLNEPIFDSNAEFNAWEKVNRVLEGYTDEYGDKFADLALDTDLNEPLLYTIGPIRSDGDVVGVVLVGTYLQNVLGDLKLKTQADITFYQSDGIALKTTFGTDSQNLVDLFTIQPSFYDEVGSSDGRTFKRSITLVGREYQLLFAPFQLRNELFAVFSIGLPSEFVVKTSTTSRTLFTTVIFLAILALFVIAFVITQQILGPVAKLVRATDRIAAGDLTRETGVASSDEIGHLASSFDQMTVKLRQRTEELEEETSKMRAILTSLADGVLVQDNEGDLIEHNPAADEMLTWIQKSLQQQKAEAEAAGNPPPDLAGTPAELLDRVGFEEVKRFDFDERTFSTLASEVITSDNQTLGSVLVLRDITPEVQAEKQKNTFIELISHELRVPLIAMKGYLDLLKMFSAGKLDEKLTSFVDKVNQNRQDLDDLIETLIDTNQLQEKVVLASEEAEEEMDSDVYPFDFGEAVKSVVEERWLPKIKEANMIFEMTIEENEEEPLQVKGHERRLKRVVGYLLDNAIKYSYPESEIKLDVKREGDNVRVDVIDHGVGLSKEAQDKIFVTRFFRALTPDFYEIRGFGMGLFLSRLIVEYHNGQISFKSKVNEGSHFTFVIPLAPPEDDDDDDWW